MENKHDPFYGVIADDFNETDYQLGGSIDIPRAVQSFEDTKIEYNQKEVSAVSCTIHGAMGAVSSLTGYKFGLEERKTLWEQALKLGADPNVGWYTSRAVDLVRKHFNRNGKHVTSFKINVGSEDFFRALRLGYRIVVSYRGNFDYNKDRNEDGILDGTYFGRTTYGHCLTISYSKGDEYELMIDNYHGIRKHNVYKVPSANLKKLISNGVFFRACYVYVENYEEKNSNVPIWALQSWEKAIKKGVVNEKDDPMKVVMGSAMEETLVKTGVFKKSEEDVTLVRWVVALDRMGLLE